MKTNKRSREKYPALRTDLNLKTRIELIDYDYVDKLDDEAKDFLNRFTEEYVNTNFKHKGKRVHKPKIKEKFVKSRNKKKKYDANAKDSYDRNNARNNDVYTTQRASNQLHYLEDLNKTGIESDEDKLIQRMDYEKLFNYNLKK